MASFWGGKPLNIIYGTFKPSHIASNGIVEIKLLPTPNNITPTTVLQQGGVERWKIKFDGYVRQLSDYYQLHADYISGAEKRFMDIETNIIKDAIIMNLSEPEYIKPDLIKYSIELVET